MQRTVVALRVLWIVLMAVLLMLMLDGLIDGWGTTLYGAVVLAVAGTELALRRRIRHT
ncbi:MAG TPA: hypothetical protein VLJ40_11110 [Arthrobacter sp.]|nr:hypothetical protein [Arthrobacter sp.]